MKMANEGEWRRRREVGEKERWWLERETMEIGRDSKKVVGGRENGERERWGDGGEERNEERGRDGGKERRREEKGMRVGEVVIDRKGERERER